MRHNKRRVRKNAVEGNISVATHYFELTESSLAPLTCFHLKYGATLAATFTFETSCFEEVAPDSTTAGDWYAETDVTITAAASSASGKVYHCGNMGALRCRLVAVVATGGALDIACVDKS
jgi:hypothetical protein